MVTLIEAIFLGVVQGMTEWLPVSSSGHLVIMQQVFGIEASLLFDVMLHLGTVFAVFVFFREEIWNILQALMRWDIYAGGRTLVYIIIGTVPVAFAGFFFHDLVATMFNSLYYVGFLMILMGFILFNTRFVKGDRKLNGIDAALVGIAQAIALIPGISRSGITMSIGLMRRVRKKQVFTFSFMLAIPAIIGANILEIYNASLTNYAITPEMLVGAVVAGVVGYMSLDILRRFVLEGKLYKFAFYCWIVGLLVLVYNVLVIYSVI